MYKILFNKLSYFIVISLLLISSLYTPTVYSQSTNNKMDTEQFTGELTKKENNTLSINKDDSIYQYTVLNDIKVVRNGSSTSLDDLKTGDMVLVTQNKTTKELVSVDVVSKSALDNSIIIISSIAGLFLLLSFLSFLFKKPNKPIAKRMTSEEIEYINKSEPK